jgi:hypothetical protein
MLSDGRITRLWYRRAIVLPRRGAGPDVPGPCSSKCFQEGEHLFVVAANSGLPRPPGWYFNLMAHPRVAVELDGRHLRLRGQLLSDRLVPA